MCTDPGGGVHSHLCSHSILNPSSLFPITPAFQTRNINSSNPAYNFSTCWSINFIINLGLILLNIRVHAAERAQVYLVLRTGITYWWLPNSVTTTVLCYDTGTGRTLWTKKNLSSRYRVYNLSAELCVSQWNDATMNFARSRRML